MSGQYFHRTLKAKRTEYNGRLYDSQHEAKRAMQLDLMQRAGDVAWWIPQVTIQLGPDHSYRVDFLVGYVRRGVVLADRLEVVAEDAKLIETREFARHKRLWRKYGPVPLHVIKRKTVDIIVRDDQ